MSDTQEFDPLSGRPETLAPGVRRVLAPNPSPMTFKGTNTYLLGETEIAVIDPGPASKPHLDAIMEALRPGQKIAQILVSHSHRDHSTLAASLAAETGAPVLAFGTSEAGRSAVMQELAASGTVGGGEGVDTAFEPDITLRDHEEISGAGWSLTVHHTPGHMGNHLCFALGDICFTGDHVMGWSTSIISPPDGDLTDFMASCHRLSGKKWKRFFPGHGHPIDEPNTRLEWLMAHRRKRETAILACLELGPATASGIAEIVYSAMPSALLHAASRNVLAHLIDLKGKKTVESIGHLGFDTLFRLR